MAIKINLKLTPPALTKDATLDATIIEIATDVYFNNIILNETITSENKLNIDFLLNYLEYAYLRYKFNTSIGNTDWITTIVSNKVIDGINVPKINIDGYPGNISTEALIVIDNIDSVLKPFFHISTDWIITDINNNSILNQLDDTTNLTSFNIPNGLLNSNEYYKVITRYKINTNSGERYSVYNIKDFKTK